MTVEPSRTHRRAAVAAALALLAGCVPLLVLAPRGDPVSALTFVLAAGAIVSVLGASKWEGSLQISAAFVCFMLAVAFVGPAGAFAVALAAEVGTWAIQRYRLVALPVNLAVSLHAANDMLRDELVPINRRYPLDALAGGFPAGTVSGAPKVRAMEIIDELEKEKRGLYAGAVGYFSAAGEMDTAIVLRTALVKDGTMYVQAGAGIVADSNPSSEQAECINKAKALFRAAEEARRFASAAGRGQ